MLTSLALVGVVAVGAAAPSPPVSPARADQSVLLSAVGEVEAADAADERRGGPDELQAVVVAHRGSGDPRLIDDRAVRRIVSVV